MSHLFASRRAFRNAPTAGGAKHCLRALGEAWRLGEQVWRCEESRRHPVLVDFWAPWCGPCKQLTPVLEKAVRSAKGAVKLTKMNIDEHPAIASQMGIQSIPAVIAFVKGKPADGFLGALPEGQVIAFLERLTKQEIGGEDKELLKEADAALAAGNAAGAAAIYAEILAETPDHLAALAGVLAAPTIPTQPHMGGDIIAVVFAVVVVGGMGSILGSIITGFALGLVEGLSQVFYPEASNTVVFVIMALVLIVRPSGLFGRAS